MFRRICFPVREGLLCFGLLVVAIQVSAAEAERPVPRVVRYCGVLQDAAGSPLSGVQGMTVVERGGAAALLPGGVPAKLVQGLGVLGHVHSF